MLRGCEPGVSAYEVYSVGGRFICMTGDSDSPIRPFVLCGLDDGGLELASIVDAEPLGAFMSTIRRWPAGVW